MHPHLADSSRSGPLLETALTTCDTNADAELLGNEEKSRSYSGGGANESGYESDIGGASDGSVYGSDIGGGGSNMRVGYSGDSGTSTGEIFDNAQSGGEFVTWFPSVDR